MDLGIAQETMTAEGIENVKNSIMVIEGLFYALNNSQVPLRFAEQALKGTSFLNQMHTQLLSKLPPEEIEKMRNQHKNIATPPPPAVA